MVKRKDLAVGTAEANNLIEEKPKKLRKAKYAAVSAAVEVRVEFLNIFVCSTKPMLHSYTTLC